MSLLFRSLVIWGVTAIGLHAQTQYTTGYQPHRRPEAPGTLIYRSPIPELGGRLTNIIYHQGWLMTGFEVPGSNAALNDLRFRVMDVSNLEHNSTPVPFWPSNFGLNFGTNDRGREHWYTGNWGYNTHAHGRTATHVHWPVLRVPNFGGAVYNDIKTDEVRFNYGWGGYDAGRMRRQLPWGASQDWAYGTDNDPVVYLVKAWRTNPNGNYNSGNYTMKPIGRVPGGQFGVRGFPDMLGDKFFITSDQRNSGLAIYQIPDTVLANYPNAAVPQMQLLGLSTENYGGYWPEFWASRDGRLYSVNADSGVILVMDLTDFSDPKIIRRFTDRGDGKGIRVRNAQYPKFQDDYLLIEKYVIDMEKLVSGVKDPIVLELAAPPRVNGVWREGFDPSQFSFPLGNLIVTGGYGEYSGGMFIHVRQQEPDTEPPTVRYHIPERDRTNYSRYMPINVIIHEELDSRTLYNGVNFMIREVSGGEPVGAPVDVIFNLGSNNVMTLTPVDPLKPDTTYQVDFPSENGVMDISGNRIVEYSWRFSTGGLVEPEKSLPVIHGITVDSYKRAPGQPFTITADVEDTGPFQYRVDYGDGNGFGSWVSVAAGRQNIALTHSYPETGRYDIRFQVQDDFAEPSNTGLNLLVYEEPTGVQPTRSSPIIVASDGRVWVVNPDSNTVSIMNGATGDKIAEIPVGRDPRGVAESATGQFWVTCFNSDEVYILNSTGAVVEVLEFDYGTAPFAVVASPDGNTMYVTAYGTGGLYQFQASNPSNRNYIPLGQTARAIAVAGDHSRVYVTRFITEKEYGEVWSVGVQSRDVRTIRVEYDETPDGNNSGSGISNYLNSIAITPQGGTAVVVGKKDNTFRGLLFRNGPGTHENTVRTTLAILDLETETEIVGARRDFDNAESPTAAAFSPDGTMLFVTLQGNNQVHTIDSVRLRDPVVATKVPTFRNTGNASETDPSGLAPQGVVIDPVTRRMYTQNFMSRSITAFDMSPAFDRNIFNYEQLGEYPTVSNELMPAQILKGKQLFYMSSDPRMSAESYISCATCHVDGAHDGRVWDFTSRGEGLRNTTDLRGRSGTGHGNVHWSANFDEIQDFELDIVNNFNGTGFITDGTGPHSSLGLPNAGRSEDLDALAAYVTSLGLGSLPRSPYRNVDGTHTQDAVLGARLFTSLNCATCHHPHTEFTDSTLGAATLHDTGTLRTTSGKRLGSTLPGIDTPTLLGLWDGAPYLHDGSAATLADVFFAVGGTTYQAENGILSGAIAALDTASGPNYGRTAFAEHVLMDGAGQSVQFDGVDGGSGGAGSIELRSRTTTATTLTLSVNGNMRTIQLTPVQNPHEWSVQRIENVQLAAGTGNVISLISTSATVVAIDMITVGNADTIARAHVHRRVLEESAEDQERLLAFLLELEAGWSGPEFFPSAPESLAALAISPNKINFMFVDGTTLETGYVVQYRAGSGEWQEMDEDAIAGVGSTAFYEFTGLTQGTKYQFRVAAKVEDVLSEWSAIVEATTPNSAGTPLQGPEITTQPDNATIAGGDTLWLSVVATGRPELAYRWYHNGVALTDDGRVAGAFTASLSVANTIGADAGSYTVVVQDLAGSKTSSAATVVITGLSILEQWRENVFGAQASNQAIAGNLADPDSDGMSNILEFAQALDPHSYQADLHPKMVLSEAGPVFEIRVRENLGDVSLKVYYSTDLSDWLEVNAEYVTEVSNVDGVRTLRVSQPVPNATSIFYRLKAE